MGLIGLDGLVSDVAMDLRDCYATALEQETQPPAEVCLVAGEDGRLTLDIGTAQDRCCAGFAWVRVAGITPETPAADAQVGGCGITSWRVSFELGSARCYPFGTAQHGPSCEEMTATALLVQQDAAAMRRALCCWTPQLESERYAVTSWTPYGPDGGCTGGTMLVSAIVDACECAEDHS